MPRNIPPISGERFNLTRLRTERTFLFRNHIADDWMTLSVAEMPTVDPDRQQWLRNLREAGMWFADIADILCYPSASSASAAYIRYCRSLGVQPQVRQSNTRVHGDTEADGNAPLPEFLTRRDIQPYNFGVEIEQVGLGLGDLTTITRGLGLPTASETRYRHDATSVWKSVPDASLNGSRNGELVSRILTGHGGFVELRRVMQALKAGGSRVDGSCGQHVHIGIEQLHHRELAMVVRAHAMFNHVFDLLLNPSRRNHRAFAAHTPWNEAMRNADAFKQNNPHDLRTAKYRSLNIAHYHDYGTFEFRSLHGCLNPRHTVSWIQLHMDFINFCRKACRWILTDNAQSPDRLMSSQFQWDSDNSDLVAHREAMPVTMAVLRGLGSQRYDTVFNKVQAYYYDAQIRDGADHATATDNAHRQARHCLTQHGFQPSTTASDTLVVSPHFAETGLGGRQTAYYLQPLQYGLVTPIPNAHWAIGRHDFGDEISALMTEDRDALNGTAQWALRILMEWVGDASFVGNSEVRRAMRSMAVKQFPNLLADRDGELVYTGVSTSAWMFPNNSNNTNNQ